MKPVLLDKITGLNGMKLLRGAALLLFGAVLTGCPGPTHAPEATGAGGKIVIKGSNTIGEELAPRLIAEYKKLHPAAEFDLQPKLTGYGLASLMAGQCDLAGASRAAIKEELDEAKSRNIELKDNVIGAYSVAVIVNSASPVANLTREQVRDIFTGATQNWKDLGGPDAPIHLVIRDPISGTYLGFKELAMENKAYASGPKMFTSYGDIAQAVAQDPSAVGYSSFEAAKIADVKPVSIGGVAPTAQTVNAGQYPYARVLRFYTNKAQESSGARDFLQFVQSAQGQQIVTQMGFVTKP